MRIALVRNGLIGHSIELYAGRLQASIGFRYDGSFWSWATWREEFLWRIRDA